jgi:hypothetical protein
MSANISWKHHKICIRFAWHAFPSLEVNRLKSHDN